MSPTPPLPSPPFIQMAGRGLPGFAFVRCGGQVQVWCGGSDKMRPGGGRVYPPEGGF
jgi:hypothetical protein